MLPTPYDKTRQPFQHFDNPEALARHRVRGEIKNGSEDQDNTNAHSGWYGHETEINHDHLIVWECGGEKMWRVFNYSKLVKEEKMAMQQKTLF